jgi:hypothetical protein
MKNVWNVLGVSTGASKLPLPNPVRACAGAAATTPRPVITPTVSVPTSSRRHHVRNVLMR